MSVPPGIQKHLSDETYPLTPEDIAFYQKYRFIKLRQVFDADTIAYYDRVISDKVAEKSKSVDPLDARNTYGKAFLQIFNLWREDESIREFVFSKRMARIAAELMQVDGVRLYHDQALYKEGGGGITPWHADQ
ncbi:MAG: phytanoyl-CoA dioxygenase, partial [Cyclobacteriaceae bacterium]|nr:phytanoyl-CoA dioxygenase [Cyclobacteriaceae bacterium]